MNRVLAGDLRAFAALDAAYRGMCEQLATRILGDPVDAEDVVQEAMFRAYRKLDSLADPSRFGAWLAAIVRNNALDHLRRRLRRNEITVDPLKIAGNPADQDPANTVTAELRGMFGALSPLLSRTCELRYIEELPISEIAIRQQIPAGTVKRRLHEARKQIRRNHMTQFNEKNAHDIIDSAKREIESLPDGIRKDIIGVAVGGDLVRGDFIPNNSSLPIIALISTDRYIDPYTSPAAGEISRIFDSLCAPYYDCAETPTVWENFITDDLHLPATAADFDPPTVPQPACFSIFLFDLIDHHETIHGHDFIRDLYRPDPKRHILRLAAETLRMLNSHPSRAGRPPVGFETVAHWQVIKMVKLLQLRFAPNPPTIGWNETISNYVGYVPEFPLKPFGESIFNKAMDARFPADRTAYSEGHAAKCVSYVEATLTLLQKHKRREE